MTRFVGPAVLLGLVLLLTWLVDSYPEPTATFTLLATRTRARRGVCAAAVEAIAWRQSQRLRGGSRSPAPSEEPLEAAGGLFQEPEEFFEPAPLPGFASYSRGGSKGVVELITASRSPLWVSQLPPSLQANAQSDNVMEGF